jgi:hypothetical protein
MAVKVDSAGATTIAFEKSFSNPSDVWPAAAAAEKMVFVLTHDSVKSITFHFSLSLSFSFLLFLLFLPPLKPATRPQLATDRPTDRWPD